MEDVPPVKKEVSCTRAFGDPVTTLAPLEEAVTTFLSRYAMGARARPD